MRLWWDAINAIPGLELPTPFREAVLCRTRLRADRKMRMPSKAFLIAERSRKRLRFALSTNSPKPKSVTVPPLIVTPS
jgi:hypothetical protein